MTPSAFTICADGGSYGSRSGYNYLTVRDETGRDYCFIGRKSVPDMNIKQAVRAVAKTFPTASITVLPKPVLEA